MYAIFPSCHESVHEYHDLFGYNVWRTQHNKNPQHHIGLLNQGFCNIVLPSTYTKTKLLHTSIATSHLSMFKACSYKFVVQNAFQFCHTRLIPAL